MSSRYALVQPGGAVLTIDHDITQPPDFNVEYNSQPVQSPYSQRAHWVGDNQIKVQEFTVEFLVLAATKAAAEAELAVIIQAAQTASSLKHVVDGVDSAFRAIQGIRKPGMVPWNSQTNEWLLRLTFKPTYGQWTATRAETDVDFEAAEKRWF